MTDRVPGAPGQYKATVTAAELQKLQAGEQFTITMVRDDQPIVEGTPYSKAAVLPDALAAIICPDVLNPTPADAFSALQAGKAPAGYGLGGAPTQAVTLSNLDNIYASGWYRLTAWAATINGVYLNYAIVFVYAYDGSAACVQEIRPLAQNLVLRRHAYNSTWSEWECENPPMAVGVEYRTTERCEGKAVYAKRISYTPSADLGNASGVVDTVIAHSISNFGTLVRIFGRIRNYPLPILNSSGGSCSINQVSASAIIFRNYKETTLAGVTLYFDLYYTKTS